MSGTVLFRQGDAAVQIESIASGSAKPAEQAGLNMALFSHTGTAYPLQALGYDPSAELGITDGAGAQTFGVEAGSASGTVIEASADGSQVGAMIDTSDLAAGGAVPDGPLALLTQWQAAAPVALFADPATQGFTASLDLSVPYAEFPGGPGAQTSSSQIVLYLGLTDVTTGREIAYGLILFDSRGSASPFFGADTGVGGTGAAIVAQTAGVTSRYDVDVAGSTGFQGTAYSGAKAFAMEITPQTLEAAIGALNSTNGGRPFSTDVANYVLTNVSVDAEVEYFGQPNALAYSVSGLTLAEGTGSAIKATVAAQSAVASGPSGVTQASGVEAGGVPTVTSLAGGDGPETIVASAGVSYSVQAGQGALTFLGSDGAATILGGAGALVAIGGTGALTASGGGGTSYLAGGSAGGNALLGGAGNVTLVGGSGGPGSVGDTLAGGSGAAMIFAGGEASTIYGGSAGTMIAAGSGADFIVAGGGEDVIYTGTGSDTVWGSPSVGASTVVVAGSGQALVEGGVGADTMYGGTGQSTLEGGAGGQLMVGGGGAMVVFAGSGSDTVFGGIASSSTLVVGGAVGTLTVLQAGAATVDAGSGGDTVFGGTGGDLVATGSGSTLVMLSAASSVSDTVQFGSGNAIVQGGGSTDRYVFDQGQSVGADLISGFRVGLDALVVSTTQRAAALSGMTAEDGGLLVPLGNGGAVFLAGVQQGGVQLFE